MPYGGGVEEVDDKAFLEDNKKLFLHRNSSPFQLRNATNGLTEVDKPPQRYFHPVPEIFWDDMPVKFDLHAGALRKDKVRTHVEDQARQLERRETSVPTQKFAHLFGNVSGQSPGGVWDRNRAANAGRHTMPTHRCPGLILLQMNGNEMASSELEEHLAQVETLLRKAVHCLNIPLPQAALEVSPTIP